MDTHLFIKIILRPDRDLWAFVQAETSDWNAFPPSSYILVPLFFLSSEGHSECQFLVKTISYFESKKIYPSKNSVLAMQTELQGKFSCFLILSRLQLFTKAFLSGNIGTIPDPRVPLADFHLITRKLKSSQ